MRQTRSKVDAGQRGLAMFSVVITVFAAGSLVAFLLTLAMSNNTRAEVERDSTEARYLAEGAVEVGRKRLTEAIANWQVAADGGATPGAVVLTDTVDIGGIPVTYEVLKSAYSGVDSEPSGVQSIVSGFEIRATAAAGDSIETVHLALNTLATPLFQFAVFYTGDLEVNPGPEMTLHGRVHSNSDIYFSPGSDLFLDTNYVRAVGGIYRHRKDNPATSNGSVHVRKWVEDPYSALSSLEYVQMLNKTQMFVLEGLETQSGYDSAFTAGVDANGDGDFDDLGDWKPFVTGALDLWGPALGEFEQSHTVLTGAHGLSEATTPFAGTTKLYEEVEAGSVGTHAFNPLTGLYEPSAAGTHDKGFYHSQAALSFVLDEAQQELVVYGPDGGTELSSGVSYASVLLDAGAVSVAEVYDARQADGGSGNVQVIEVDVEVLGSLIEPQTGAGGGVVPPVIDLSSAPSDGGGIVLYAAATHAGEGTTCGGVLLKNGADLPDLEYLGGNGGLTVVSENPVYVQGDYNTSGKLGAAVIADGVNLLSNAWDGSKSSSSGLPSASDTTFNLAILTGNQETEPGTSYNGGLENLPRFHESWSGIACNISGSFVNTWDSEKATGAWKYGGNRYTAPRRNWSYDTDFNEIANLPPFTPMAVTAEDVARW